VKPPAISAADLMRVFATLRPRSGKDKKRIAEMLGFAWPERAGKAIQKSSKKLTGGKKKELPLPLPSPVNPAGGESELEMPMQQSTVEFTLAGPQPGTMTPPKWRLENTAFDTSQRTRSSPRQIDPLLAPLWTRSILSTALSRKLYDGPPDIARIIERMLKQTVIRELPHLPVLSMARSIQVLIDVGDNMLPFVQDQRGLLKAIRRLAGRENIEELKFVGTPLRKAGASDIDSWEPYRMPALGTQVLLLTDLGISRPSLASPPAPELEWYSFARTLLVRGIQATAFVPYPANRWPKSLKEVLRIVEWDRRTTVARVRFAPEPGRRL